MSAAGRNKTQGKLLSNGAQVIAADAYPAVMAKADAAQFIANLKSDDTARRSEQAIAASRDTMRTALEGYVQTLGAASRALDIDGLFAQAHEIRGLAETAGLGVAGTMANGLCLYIDALDGAAPDRATVRLHVEAIERVVSGEDAGAIANVVAEELTALVIRKLGETKALGLPK
jgi:hypothetical protein